MARTDLNVNPAAAPPNRPTNMWRPTLQLSRFDRVVVLIIILLSVGIGLTIVLGDRVGVTLERVAPLGNARSTSNVVLQFSENMNRATVEERLRVAEVKPGTNPEQLQDEDVIETIQGEIRWSAKTAIFRPESALRPGASYAVIFASGAASEGGREVLSEYRFTFNVRSPRVAYLAPANSAPLNIWIADPSNPSSATQITNSPSGVWDYTVSPDGSQIAFSEKNTSTGTSDIKLIDLESGAIRQLTNCPDAECKTPTWRPDGQVIGYERIELNSDFTQVGVSPTRIWLLDLSTDPATTRPLFSDSQMLGYGLQWSGDGNRITVYDYNSQGIVFHQFNPDSTAIIPSQYGGSGWLSPDGTRIVYPEILLEESQARSYLTVVDMEAQEAHTLTMPGDPIDDDTAAWSPDGEMLAVGRRYLDERYTRGKQLYLVNPDDGSAEELLVDAQYQLGIFVWDPNGTQLLLQRFPDPVAMSDPTNPGLPQIWTIDIASKMPVKIADNAFYPRWIP